jgi:hypothetical protein
MTEADITSPQNSEQALDEHLYSEVNSLASFQAYEYLSGSPSAREDQKQKFLSGEISDPVLDYPDLDIEQITAKENDLLSKKSEILNLQINEIVKQTYRWKLNEKIAEIRLLRAAAYGDMRRFKKYSEFIYGKPSLDVFNYSVGLIREAASQSLSSDNEQLSTAAKDLLKNLPIVPEVTSFDLPDESTVTEANIQVMSELGDLVDLGGHTGKMDAEQIKDAFSGALHQIEAEGWQVVIDDKTSKTAISVNQEKQHVQVPQGRTASTQKVSSLIAHELGTHVYRRVNGERSRLKLLGIGLDRYERGEEGIATMREQALKNQLDDFSGMEGHLAVSLASGLDGNPRDFQQVFQIMQSYYLFSNIKKGKELEEARTKASNSAWNRTVRTFRGTDCQTPGVCFTKDIVYREGNISIWEIIKTDPEEMVRFNVGKYDPSNDRHIWVLEQLGINDNDLQSLESE